MGGSVLKPLGEKFLRGGDPRLANRRHASCLGRNGRMNIKKRHHFVPIAYLKSFCDDEGKVFVYRKDDPKKRIHQKPDKTGFHKYYYSQPLPEGGMEHDCLEDIFSKVEAKWPPIVERLQSGKNVDESMMNIIFNFIGLQYARVPATRDAIEKLDAESVKMEARKLEAIGELPPPLKGFEDIFRADRLEVAIDPHRSVLAMPQMMSGVGRILDQIWLNVVFNETDIPFLTSDNPVIWFDPSISEKNMRPYEIQLGGLIKLVFPIAPNIMILGRSRSFLSGSFFCNSIKHLKCKYPEVVNKYNRYICRFAYETVFAQEKSQEILINEYANVSPVLETTQRTNEKGGRIVPRLVFGKRKRKPAWKRET